jgi:uncharacterized Zn finger protein (UPF0148 family)
MPPKPKETQVSLASLGQQTSVNHESSVAQPKLSPDTSCPNCGHAVRPGAVFCPNCRYQLLPAVTTPHSHLRTLPVLEISNDKAMTSSIASQAQQERKAVLDDVAVRSRLQRLWDRAGR